MLQNVNTEVVQVWRAWYFSHTRSSKGRENLFVCGHTRDSEQEKTAKVAGNLLAIGG